VSSRRIRSRLHGIFARRREDRGAVAVEFALISPVFFLLVVMTLELGLVLLTQSVLDLATETAARQIMIGAVTTSGAFQTQLCNVVTPLIPCGSLQVNVQSAGAFTGFSLAVPTDGAGNMTNTQFSPGSAGQSVLVQVGYNRPYLISWVGGILGGGHDSSLLLSTLAFENEMF